MSMKSKQPVLFVTHGGGPMPLIGKHESLKDFFLKASNLLPCAPKAIVVVSAHWEEPIASVTTSEKPSMLFDYYGFPPETYKFKYDSPGSPELANRVIDLLKDSGIPCQPNASRGYDHGVFVPLLPMFPKANIPVIALSLVSSLDPSQHIAIGKALAPLRDDNVLILGSGASWHSGNGADKSAQWNNWLVQTTTDTVLSTNDRETRLVEWEKEAPYARSAHPREEHLLPLHVCAAAAGFAPAKEVWRDQWHSSTWSSFLWSQ